MFAQQVERAIDDARGARVLDDLSRLLWRGFSEGLIGDDEAQRLADRLHIRRNLNTATSAAGESQRPPAGSTGRPRVFGPPRRPQRPPIRSQAVERRRRVAASGGMPPAIAARFSTAEIAVLSIVAFEMRHKGRCSLCLDEIAGRAGCSRSSAKNAIRTAARLGFIRVTHRPRRGQKSLPNIVEVVSPEWLTWIRRGPGRLVDRGQKFDLHEYKNQRFSQSGKTTTESKRPNHPMHDHKQERN